MVDSPTTLIISVGSVSIPRPARSESWRVMSVNLLSSLPEPDARVEDGVDDVGEEVEDDGDDAGDDEEGHHTVGVESAQAVDEQTAHSLPFEHRLGDDGTADDGG